MSAPCCYSFRLQRGSPRALSRPSADLALAAPAVVAGERHAHNHQVGRRYQDGDERRGDDRKGDEDLAPSLDEAERKECSSHGYSGEARPGPPQPDLLPLVQELLADPRRNTKRPRPARSGPLQRRVDTEAHGGAGAALLPARGSGREVARGA